MDCIKKKKTRVLLVKFRKYIYEDSGLAYNMQDFKMVNYKEKWEIIQQVEENKKKTDIRFFPEYNNINGRDIIVSIEYW